MISSISNSQTASGPQAFDPTAFAQKLFAKVDSDSDGKISVDEFTSAIEKRLGKNASAGQSGNAPDPAQVFKQLDTDGDGQLTAAEFTAGLKALRGHGHRPPPPDDQASSGAADVFKKIDTNSDGSVTQDELTNFLKSRHASKQSADQTAATSSGRQPDFSEIFKTLDADQNGSIDETEFEQQLSQFRRPPPPGQTYGPSGSDSGQSSGSNLSAQA